MTNDIELLKNYPSITELDRVLDNYKNPSFPLISALLNYTVPQIYLSLPNSTESKLRYKFQSLIGFGNLLSKVSSVLNVPNSDAELRVYFDFLLSVVDEQFVVNIASNRTSPELKEIDKLVFKGKLLSVVNEVTISKGWDITNVALQSSKSYAHYLSTGVAKLYQQGLQPDIFVQSLLNLSAESLIEFFSIFFTRDYWAHFEETLHRQKDFQRRDFTKRFF